MLAFGKNLLIFAFLVGIVISATMFSDLIKSVVAQQLQSVGKHVLGISISNTNSVSVPKSVQKEIDSTVNNAKQQALQINVQDVLNAFSASQKIVHDVSGLQQAFHNELKQLAK